MWAYTRPKKRWQLRPWPESWEIPSHHQPCVFDHVYSLVNHLENTWHTKTGALSVLRSETVGGCCAQLEWEREMGKETRDILLPIGLSGIPNGSHRSLQCLLHKSHIIIRQSSIPASCGFHVCFCDPRLCLARVLISTCWIQFGL